MIGLRLATSYFAIDESFAPVAYAADSSSGPQYTRLGLSVEARVAVIGLAVEMGLTDWIQVSLTVPVTVVDAHASDVVPIIAGGPPPQGNPSVVSTSSPSEFDRLLEHGTIEFDSVGFNPAGAGGPSRFQEGTVSGLGRVALGSKIRVGTVGKVDFAVAPELFLPSPSEGEYAGSDTAAILVRGLASAPFGDSVRLLLELGYDYDFDSAELTRFLWSIGCSTSFHAATFDFGFSGSVYEDGIEWTPSRAPTAPTPSNPDGLVFFAEGPNRLGTNDVDFLVGLKIRVAEGFMITAQASVPVNDGGVRPDATGTLGFELYL